MGIARELVHYADNTKIEDLFVPDVIARLQTDPGARSLLNAASGQQSSLQWAVIALQALQIQRSEKKAGEVAEFVATVPAGVACAARPTSVVVREMLAGPHHQVIALGYEISDADVIERLHAASLACPDVILLCDQRRQSARNLSVGWPTDRHRPKFFENVTWTDAAPKASMHCKALLVDGSDLLVTSANFTFHGLAGNIEFGVRLHGELARPARGIFLELLQSGLFRPVEV